MREDSLPPHGPYGPTYQQMLPKKLNDSHNNSPFIQDSQSQKKRKKQILMKKFYRAEREVNCEEAQAY